MATARQYIFDTYTRTHRCIDISTLANRLDIDVGDAEPRIVQLIRDAGVDAKIDSKKNQVVMGSRQPTVYQDVINKTKALSYRTNQLYQQIESKYAARADN